MSDDKKERKLDPIFQEYAKKILGEDAEMPKDYTSLVVEARRRGRAGEQLPHLKPHRCDKHLQDFLDGIFLWEGWQPGKTYFKCMRSAPGEEPERYKLKGDVKSLNR